MRDGAPEKLKNFLISPDQKGFSDIFDIAFIYTRGYLFYLRQKGYRLPLDLYSEEAALDDLTIDILGSLFHSKPKQPFYVIFEFFRSNGVVDFQAQDEHNLWALFEKLLKGFTHQELTRLKKQANPQVEVLKRRFKDILKDASYSAAVRGYLEFVYPAGQEPDFNLPVIPYEELRSFAEDAFRHSVSRTAWCRKIFELLDQKKTYCRAVPRCELLRAIVSVNIAFLQIPEFGPEDVPGPREGAIRNIALDIKKQTLKYIDHEVIQPFVLKKRILADDISHYLTACGRYLDDFSQDGDSDAIPVYFREVMPAAYSERYLNDFKYVFESVLQRAREDFASRMKKNPIIRQYRYYWNMAD